MRLFGLTPDAALARIPTGTTPRIPTLGWSIGYGAFGFAAVSVLAYSIWAYHWVPGTGAMYGAIAAVYLVLSGVVLSRLVIAPRSTTRFAVLFATAFLAYALLWCAFWFGLKGRHQADLWGAASGLAAATWIFHRGFGERRGVLASFVMLFTLHALGYYLGGMLHRAVPGTGGRLLWGVAYGLGFGAGLGAVLFRCQSELKNQLLSAASR